MTNQHDKEMLLPCPFCGGCDVRFTPAVISYGEQLSDDMVECQSCEARIHDYKAHNTWNTRATTRYEAALREAVSALEAFQRGDAKIQVIVAEALTTINEILEKK